MFISYKTISSPLVAPVTPAAAVAAASARGSHDLGRDGCGGNGVGEGERRLRLEKRLT